MAAIKRGRSNSRKAAAVIPVLLSHGFVSWPFFVPSKVLLPRFEGTIFPVLSSIRVLSFLGPRDDVSDAIEA